MHTPRRPLRAASLLLLLASPAMAALVALRCLHAPPEPAHRDAPDSPPPAVPFAAEATMSLSLHDPAHAAEGDDGHSGTMPCSTSW